MPYIGKGANGFGIRERYRYSASGSQTAFTGSDLDGKTLQIDSGSLIDVYLNGVLLDTADYNTNTANQVTLTSGATASDEVMIVVYDVFSLSDAMPKTGGTFTGGITGTTANFSGAITGNLTGNASGTASTVTTAAQPNITSVGTLTGLTTSGAVDVNGNELILDADADTSITADTDDQIDIKVGGSDLAHITSTYAKLRGATPLVFGENNSTGTFQSISGEVGANNLLLRSYQSLEFKNGTSSSSLTDGTSRFKIDASGNVGIGASPESGVKLEVNAGSDGAVAISGRSDGGNGNNRRFNIIPYSSNGTYGGGLRLQTRNTSNVFHTVVEYNSAQQEVFHGNYRTADVPNQFSSAKHWYTGTEYGNFSNAGSGVANAQTMTTYLAYQGIQIVCVKVYYNSDSALMHETFATICNQYHNSGVATQHSHNGTGIIDSVSLSLTGGYNTRRLVVTLDPATGYTGNNYTYVTYYGYTLN